MSLPFCPSNLPCELQNYDDFLVSYLNNTLLCPFEALLNCYFDFILILCFDIHPNPGPMRDELQMDLTLVSLHFVIGI